MLEHDDNPRVYVGAHARPSQSQSLSPSTNSLNYLKHRTDNYDSDLDAHARERGLAKEISEYWNVEDSLLVVLEYGVVAVARIHRRMLSMSRKQKLNHVTNLGGYFMVCLEPHRKRSEADTERTDAFYEEYLARQKARGLSG